MFSKDVSCPVTLRRAKGRPGSSVSLEQLQDTFQQGSSFRHCFLDCRLSTVLLKQGGELPFARYFEYVEDQIGWQRVKSSFAAVGELKYIPLGISQHAENRLGFGCDV